MQLPELKTQSDLIGQELTRHKAELAEMVSRAADISTTISGAAFQERYPDFVVAVNALDPDTEPDANVAVTQRQLKGELAQYLTMRAALQATADTIKQA